MTAAPIPMTQTAPVDLNIALTSKQAKTVTTPYDESAASRFAAYTVEKPRVVRAACLNAAEHSLHKVILGGVGGWVGGLVLGKWLYPTSAAAGAVALGAAAAVVGGKIGHDAIVAVRESEDYRRWAETRATLATNKVFMDLIDADEILPFLKCPISGQIPECPVSTPEGFTFDYQSLIEWRAANPNQRYKNTDSSCALAQLKFDFATCNTLIHRLQKLQAQARQSSPLWAFLNTLSDDIRDVVILTIHTGYFDTVPFRTPEDRAIFAEVSCVPRELLGVRIDERTNNLKATKARRKEVLAPDTVNLPFNEKALIERERDRTYVVIVHLDSEVSRFFKSLFNISPNVLRTTVVHPPRS